MLKAGQEASEEDMLEFCREQVAHFKIPRTIRCRTELPITVTGEAHNFKMRKATVEEPPLGEALEKDLIED